MPEERRADKTREKLRRAALPAPTEHSREVAAGDGRPCDGCTETIHPSEMMYTVRVWTTLDWRFHEGCFEAWLTFRQSSTEDTE